MNNRIKKLRRALDLTQECFGERVGLTQNSITLIETGKRNISDFSIRNICREFNVNEEWLRTGKGEMFLPDASDEIEALVKKYHLPVGVQVLIEKFVNLKPEAQDNVINFIMETAAGIESLLELGVTPNSRINLSNLDNLDVMSLEKEYKKSRLNSASKTTLSASNTTEEKTTKNKKNA